MLYYPMLENDMFHAEHQCTDAPVQNPYWAFLDTHTKAKNRFLKTNLKKFKVSFRPNKEKGTTELRDFEVQFQKKPEKKFDRRAITSRENGKKGGRPYKTEYSQLFLALKAIDPNVRDKFIFAAMSELDTFDNKLRERESDKLRKAELERRRQGREPNR